MVPIPSAAGSRVGGSSPANLRTRNPSSPGHMLRLPAHARRYRLSHYADAIGRRQERWGHQSGAAVQIVSDIFEDLSPIGPVHGAVLLGPRPTPVRRIESPNACAMSH